MKLLDHFDYHGKKTQLLRPIPTNKIEIWKDKTIKKKSFTFIPITLNEELNQRSGTDRLEQEEAAWSEVSPAPEVQRSQRASWRRSSAGGQR